MAAIPGHRCTLDEYVELDRNSEERLEYFDGAVVSMSGGSVSHNRIAINVITGLHSRSANRECAVFPADMRLPVPKAPPYRYADVVVVCGNPVIEKIQGLDVLLNQPCSSRYCRNPLRRTTGAISSSRINPWRALFSIC